MVASVALANGGGIEEYSEYFDRLVQLIPASYYLPQEELPNGAEKYYRGQSQKAKDKQEQKASSKKAKRAKFDPESADKLDTLQAQKDRVEEDARKLLAEEDDGHQIPAPPAVPVGFTPERAPSSMDELRSRLQKKVQEFRDKRNADKVEQARQWRDKAHQAAKSPTARLAGERRDNRGVKPGKGGKKDQDGAIKTGKRGRETDTKQSTSGKKSKASVVDGIGEPQEQKTMKAKPIVPEETYLDVSFEYNKFEDKESDMKYKTKLGKRKLDAKTELVKASKLQERLKKDAEEGFKRNLAEKHAWTSALARADGKKVKDDPKRLKNTLKREQKLKEKKRADWEERKKTQEEQRTAKQQKRKANLKARRDGKIQRKIDRREAKLSRPGFEGRSGAFLNP